MNSKEKTVKEIARPKIAQLRERANLTQSELSQKLGISETTMQNWESGRSGIEQLERFVKLCRLLNCQAEDLIEFQKPEIHIEANQAENNEPEVFINEIRKMLIKKKTDIENS